MRGLCAWCGAPLDAEGTSQLEAGPITHGICPACAEKVLREGGGTRLREFLGSLEIPVLLVDDDVRVRGETSAALTLLGKRREDVEDHLAGEVFSCVNAELPGGCGQTELCSACTVRNTVTRTYETGRSQIRVPATLQVSEGGERKELELRITTQKVGDRVLVQVEPAAPE